MSFTVITKAYNEPAFSEREMLRYAGGGGEEIHALCESCLAELEGGLTYSVCYARLPLSICESRLDFTYFSAESKDLAKNLRDAESVILFGATVGSEIDRLILKYSRISPSRALMLQAIGAERIEALCDVFCKDMETETGRRLCPRFSAGYGDLDIAIQRDIIRLLDTPKRLGLSLCDSMLMSPTKSVTAFVGVRGEDK